MELTINFESKTIKLTGNVNLQELVTKLMDLNINLAEYTLINTSAGFTLGNITRGTTGGLIDGILSNTTSYPY